MIVRFAKADANRYRSISKLKGGNTVNIFNNYNGLLVLIIIIILLGADNNGCGCDNDCGCNNGCGCGC